MGDDFFKQYQQSLLAKKHEGFNTPPVVIDDIVNRAVASKIKLKEKIVKGESNEVYSITTESGQELIIRISRNNNTKRLEAEKWALDKCNKLDSIPTPEVFLVDKINLNSTESIVVSVESKLKGVPMGEIKNLSLEEKNQLIFQAGKILSEIHSIEVDGFGPLDKNGKGTFTSIKEILTDDYINKEKILKISKNIGLDNGVILKAFEILEKGVSNYPATKSKLVHCDFSPNHILIDNKKITGIIDFELVEGSDPIRDLARWQFFFEQSYPVQNLMDGYANKDIFTENFNEIFNFWKIHLGVMQLAYYTEENNSLGLFHTKEQLTGDVDYYNQVLSSKK